MCDKLKWLSIIDNNLKTIDGKRLKRQCEVAEVCCILEECLHQALHARHFY